MTDPAPITPVLAPTEPVVDKSTTPIIAKPTEEVKTDDVFTKLVRQESHIRDERKKLIEAKKAHETEMKELEDFRSLKKMKETNPLKVLESLGINYNSLSQHVADSTRPLDPAIRKALEGVEGLKNEIAQRDAQELHERNSKAEAYLKEEINKVVSSDSYDVIRSVKAEDAVREYMEEMYASTGEIPEVKDACEAVSNHILDLYTRVADSNTYKNVQQQKAAQKAAESSAKVDKSLSKDEAIAKSLTNKMTQSTSIQARPMNDQERLKAAVQAFAAAQDASRR